MANTSAVGGNNNNTYQFPKGKVVYLSPNSFPSKTPIALICCGSFNPVTILHLRMFEMAKDHYKNTNYEVVACYFSPVSDDYKKKGLITSDHRINMLELACKSSDYLMVDPWEANKPKWIPTKLVLDHFIEELNKDLPTGHPAIKAQLLCGSDLLDSFNTPNLWLDEDIKVLCSYGIVCVSRAGSDPLQVVWSNDLLYSLKSKIIILYQWLPNDVSSTVVRKALSRGLSILHLTDEKVVQYIKKHNLYKPSKL